MLFLAIGLAIPTILVNTFNVKGVDTSIENQPNALIVSDILAFLLLAVYIAGIIFTFFTHKHLFSAQSYSNNKKDQKEAESKKEKHSTAVWTKKKSFLLLGLHMAE
jgi:Ca2+/H+ antiporter